MGLKNPSASGGGGSSTWGGITGNLSDQTDLQTALNAKLTIGGDSKGAKITIGTNDSQDFALKTNNTDRLTVKNTGNILIGTDANLTDYPNASVVIAEGNTGHTFSGKIGLTAEVLSNGIDPCTGIGGNAATNGGSVAARGVTGVAIASNPTDTGNAIGVYAYSNSVHTGGNNFGLNAKATNANSNFGVYSDASGGTNNWSFYGQAGNIYNNGSIAIKTTNPTKDLSFDGTENRTAGLERHTTANTAGVNFTINGGGATSGATDKNSGMVSIRPGLSTGTGLGSLRLQGLTRAASTGTTDNALVDRIIVPSRKYLTDETVVGLFEIALGNNQTTGGTINYTVHATDGTEYQSHSGVMNWAAVSKGSVITTAFGHVNAASGLETDADSSGTLNDTFSVVAGTGKITISLRANSSLTTPTIWIEYIIFNQGSTAVTQL